MAVRTSDGSLVRVGSRGREVIQGEAVSRRTLAAVDAPRHPASYIGGGGIGYGMSSFGSTGRTSINWGAEIDPRASSVVNACLKYLTSAFGQGIPVVTGLREGSREQRPAHPVPRLVTAPNPAYSGRLLRNALIADLCIVGDAYMLKVRDRARGDGVTQLWWLPALMTEPVRAPGLDEFHRWIQVLDWRTWRPAFREFRGLPA